jgi:general secretion pathway protein L
MFEASTDLRLFGYDLRSALGFVKTGFAQLLWKSDSPIRLRFDEPVLASVLASESGAPVKQLWFRGADVLEEAGVESNCRAVVLPDAMVLSRTITLPSSLSRSVSDAVLMNVKAFSPFPEDDTAFGWRVKESGSDFLVVDIAIASRAAVAGVLRDLYAQQQDSPRDQNTAKPGSPENDIHAQEVWSFMPGSQQPIVLHGFGEGVRDSLYLKRLLRLTIGACAIVLGVALAPLLSGVVLSLRADSLDAQVAQLTAMTADELSMREDLAVVRELGERVTEEIRGQANFRIELEVLTEQMPDTAFANRIELSGRQLRVSGLAQDAATLMAQLSEYPGYAQVVSQGGFRRDRSGAERYTFEISLSEYSEAGGGR